MAATNDTTKPIKTNNEPTPPKSEDPQRTTYPQTTKPQMSLPSPLRKFTQYSTTPRKPS